MIKNIIKKIIFASFFIQFLVSANLFAHGEHLGKITFQTSANIAAEPHFLRGLMWLHSFEYDKARESFLLAEKADPSFALAYWGESMTYNHPVWGEQDLSAGRKALEKLGKTNKARLAKAKLPIEKLFLNAAAILYGKGDKSTRDAAYLDAMRDIYFSHPNNDEAASFYALALLGKTAGERNFRNYMQAAGIGEEIYSRNPCHPGALHYVIHSYDDPIHAPLGLRAARKYAQLAPDASHALHMPSHIFLALGMWDEVIISNRAAWEAAEKQNPNREANVYTLDDLHALEWLSYGYLEKRDFKQALKLTQLMGAITLKSQKPMPKWYYTFMRDAYILESGDWASQLPQVDLKGIELSAVASNLYTEAMRALNKKNLSEANKLLMHLQEKIKTAKATKSPFKDYFTAVTPAGIRTAKIIALELAAQISRAEGNFKKGILLLQKAVQVEASMSFGYGPPKPVKPSNELLAEFLLREKHYNQAFKAYKTALERAPNRTIAKRGLEKLTQKMQLLGLKTEYINKPYFNKLMNPDYYH